MGVCINMIPRFSEDWFFIEACKLLSGGGPVRPVTFPPIFEETIKVIYPNACRTYYYESFDKINYKLARIEER